MGSPDPSALFSLLSAGKKQSRRFAASLPPGTPNWLFSLFLQGKYSDAERPTQSAPRRKRRPVRT